MATFSFPLPILCLYTGGSWASAVMTFADVDESELFGPATDLTLGVVELSGPIAPNEGKMLQCCTTSFVKAFLGDPNVLGQ